MNSPAICKFKFYYPNSRNKAGNIANMGNFMSYIENRPGTDRAITDSDLQLERKALGIEPEMGGFIKYASDRPGSTGIFDQCGIADLPEYQKSVNQREGPCWDFMISLTEEDAAELGFDNKDKWQELVRSSMPDMMRELKIDPEHTKWVAAYHPKEGHPHVHLLFWETEVSRKQGKITKSECENIKRTLFTKVYAEYNKIHTQLKGTARTLAHDMMVRDLRGVVLTEDKLKELFKDSKYYQELRQERKLSGDPKSDYIKIKEKELYESFLKSRQAKKITVPQLKSNQQSALSRDITNLSEKLPYFKTPYAKLSDEQKKLIDDIYEKHFLKQPSIIKQREKFIDEAVALAKKYAHSDDKLNQAKEKAQKEIDNRLKSEIINAAQATQKSANNLVIKYRQLAKTVKQLNQSPVIKEILTDKLLIINENPFVKPLENKEGTDKDKTDKEDKEIDDSLKVAREIYIKQLSSIPKEDLKDITDRLKNKQTTLDYAITEIYQKHYKESVDKVKEEEIIKKTVKEKSEEKDENGKSKEKEITKEIKSKRDKHEIENSIKQALKSNFENRVIKSCLRDCLAKDTKKIITPEAIINEIIKTGIDKEKAETEIHKSITNAYIKTVSIMNYHAGVKEDGVVKKICKTLNIKSESKESEQPESKEEEKLKSESKDTKEKKEPTIEDKIKAQVKAHFQQCEINKRYDRVTTPTKQEIKLAEVAIQKPIEIPFERSSTKTPLLGHAISTLFKGVTQALSSPTPSFTPSLSQNKKPKLKKFKKRKPKEKTHEYEKELSL